MYEEKLKKIDKFLEALGSAVVFTLIEIIALYLLLSIDLFNRYNIFLIYRAFFEKFLFVFNTMYFLLADLLYVIFGESYLHIVGFNNVFKLVFLTIFLINFAYFFIVKYVRPKNETS